MSLLALEPAGGQGPRIHRGITAAAAAPARLTCRPEARRRWPRRTAATDRDGDPAATSSSTPNEPPLLPSFVAPLLGAGAVTGPLLDGIHGRVGLLTYDVLPFDVGGLHSAATVPLLLGVFYALMGGAHVWLDRVWGDSDADTAALQGRVDGGYVALTYGVLAALLQLSAALYAAGADYATIGAVLAAAGAANWWALERTKQGLALALLCAVGAPAAEVVLMRVLGVWHYPHGDLLGLIPSWVPACYFFYTPAVGNLARWLWKRRTS